MTSWPDNVVKLAKAIAKAEGSNPAWNNPGDLTGIDRGSFPVTGVVNQEGVWKFLNPEDGWNALYMKVNRMLAGKSAVYSLDMTLDQVGIRYSGGDFNWAKNVAAALGVPESTTLRELTEDTST